MNADFAKYPIHDKIRQVIDNPAEMMKFTIWAVNNVTDLADRITKDLKDPAEGLIAQTVAMYLGLDLKDMLKEHAARIEEVKKEAN